MGTLNKFNLNEYITKFDTQVFVETGLGTGNSFNYARQFSFNKLYSCDIDNLAITKYNADSNDSRLTIFGQSSEISLPIFLQEIENSSSNILFWLDAHFPNETNGAAYDQEQDLNIRLPLEKELNLIFQERIRKNFTKDVIIIDDLRIYKDQKYSGGSMKEIGLDHIAKYGLDFLDNYKPTHNFIEILDDQGYLILEPNGNSK